MTHTTEELKIIEGQRYLVELELKTKTAADVDTL